MCLVCRHTFGKPKRILGKLSDFITFHDFVVNKINKVALSEELFLSRKSIWRRFKPFFRYSPTSSDSLFLLEDKGFLSDTNIWVMGIDGKWLHRHGVVMIYRNVTNKVNLYWSWHVSESYEAITADFKKLVPIMRETLPNGVVTDWKGAIVAGVNSFLPPIPHQRCLSHVQRQLMAFLPLRSPIIATQQLRSVAQIITKINSYEEKNLWVSQVNDWIIKYSSLLKEKTKGVGTKRHWWYTHGNLRRAVKLLKFDEDNLFAYLTFLFIPKTNNSLEGVNSQIKGKLSNHRGMQTHQQVTYIFWLLTFSRVETRKDLKKLWDSLKTKIFRF